MYDSDPRTGGPAPHPRRLFGVYIGIVRDVVDADRLGEIEVELPWVSADDASVRLRARVSSPMAGKETGWYLIPDPGTEVLLSFIGGSIDHPVVVGSLWNGAAPTSETMDGNGKNEIRSFTTRNGSRLTFTDPAPAPAQVPARGSTSAPKGAKVELTTPKGRTVSLDDESGDITIESRSGQKVTIGSSGKISIEAASEVTIKGGSKVTIEALKLDCKAPQADFVGQVKCKLLVSEMVTSKLYTAGGGNVL